MTAGTLTLSAFLEARLAEDEAVARAAITDPYPVRVLGAGVWETETGEYARPQIIGDDLIIYDEGGHDLEHATHIARHDPARVLREVTAKRAVVVEHAPYAAPWNYSEPHLCGACSGGGGEGAPYPCPTLCHIASVYDEHPDYRQEWS